MTVKRLLREIDATELVEWQAYLMIQHEDRQRQQADDKLRSIFGKKK